jgi:hypothetical protein
VHYLFEMFLLKLYQQWRSMFWAIVLLLLCQMFFMYKGIQNTPFMLYSMFSTIHSPKDSFPVLLIKTNEGYFNHFVFSNREAEMLLNDIDLYINLKKNGGKDDIGETITKRFKGKLPQLQFQYLIRNLSNDATSIERFPIWWKRYFNAIYPNNFDSITVLLSNVRFKDNMALKSPQEAIIFTVYNK